MDDGEEFRNQAKECRALANKQRSAANRATLLHLAKQWDLLAEEQERYLITKRRQKV